MCLTINPLIHKFPTKEAIAEYKKIPNFDPYRDLHPELYLRPVPLVAEEDMVVFKAMMTYKVFDKEWMKETDICNSGIASVYCDPQNPELNIFKEEIEKHAIRIPLQKDTWLSPYRKMKMKVGKEYESEFTREAMETRVLATNLNSESLNLEEFYHWSLVSDESGYVYEVNGGYHAFSILSFPLVQETFFEITTANISGLLNEGLVNRKVLDKVNINLNRNNLSILVFLHLKKAIIPKGTRFYYGVDGDVVAEKMILTDEDVTPYLSSRTVTDENGDVKEIVEIRCPQTVGKYKPSTLCRRMNTFSHVAESEKNWRKFDLRSQYADIIEKNNSTVDRSTEV